MTSLQDWVSADLFFHRVLTEVRLGAWVLCSGRSSPRSYFFMQITDLSAGINFVVLAILSFVWGGHNDPAGYTTRRIVITAIVAASRLELGAFLFYRVVSRGKDARFDEMREKFLVRRGLFCEHAIGTLAHSDAAAHARIIVAPAFFCYVAEHHDFMWVTSTAFAVRE